MSFKEGDEVEIDLVVTDEMVRQYAEITGDKNPVHLDDEYAKTTRFGRRIVHGMLLGGFISRALAMNLGVGGIYLAQSVKFLAPVFIDDHIVIKLKVTHLRDKSGIGLVETNILKKDTQEICVKGEATIMKKDGVQKLKV